MEHDDHTGDATLRVLSGGAAPGGAGCGARRASGRPEAGHHPASSIAEFTRLARLAPDGADLSEYEAAARKAIVSFERGIRMAWVGHMFLAHAYFLQGRWDETIESAETSDRPNTWGAFAGITWATLLSFRAYAGPRRRSVALG